MFPNWCGRCPDTSLSQPVRHWETEPPQDQAGDPGLSMQGQKKSGISLSGILEQPNARLAGETALKCHRAQNGKNNLVNKRRQPVQVQQCKPLNIYHLSSPLFKLYHCILHDFTNCDATGVAFVHRFLRFPGWMTNLKNVFLIYTTPF